MLDYLRNGKIDLVINLPTTESKQVENNYLMRRTAVDFGVPLLTNIHLVKLFSEAIAKYKKGELIGLQVRVRASGCVGGWGEARLGMGPCVASFRWIPSSHTHRLVTHRTQSKNLFDYYNAEKPEEAWTSPSEFH